MSEIAESNSPVANHILASLPAKEYQLLSPKLEEVALTYGANIYQQGEIIPYIYFLNSGIVSLLATFEDNPPLEVGLIGKEGLAGLPVFLGVKTSLNRVIVQGAGLAMKMLTVDFLKACQNGGALPSLLRRFTHSLLAQVSQSAVCYRFHPVEARLARWLLMTSDRLETNDFPMTQEFLSSMLGVRREAVNKSAVFLNQQDLINYSRGNLKIIDQTGLVKAACVCYAIVKKEEKSYTG